MKKIIFITISTLILSSLIIVVIFNYNKNEKQTNRKNINATTETFTITDKGTEIEVKLINKNNHEILVKQIITTLYDSQNKKITFLNYKKEIQVKKEKNIKITSKEKYPNTSSIKYKLYI